MSTMKSMIGQRVLSLILGLFLLGASVSWAQGALMDQKSVLTGQVSSNGLVQIGMTVRVGTPLVMIDTPVGPVPAVRANVDGVVREVLVQPGEKIQPGVILVRLEPVPRR